MHFDINRYLSVTAGRDCINHLEELHAKLKYILEKLAAGGCNALVHCTSAGVVN
jgi:hypothetical protein